MHFRCEGRHGSHQFLDRNSQSQRRKLGETYGAAIWQIPELYSQLNSLQLEWIACLDAHTCKIKCVLWWLSGRQDKFISIDEENLLPWSLDSSRKAAQMENRENGYPQWDELPADILAAIMNKVPLEEKLGVVPSLCKSWCKAVMDPCSWKIVDLEKFSLEHAGDTAMVERMLRFLLNRSSGCLRNLYIVRLENDTLFSLVAEMVTLEKLLLPEGRMSDAIVVEHAARFSNLRFLDLSYCMNVGAPALEALGKNCPLEGLCRRMLPNNLFHDVSQDEEVVAIATTMHKLKILRINYLKFQNESILKVLSSCPDLRDLDVRGCWEVNLANHIDKYPSLTVLGPHIEDVIRDFNEFIRARHYISVVDPYLYTSDSDEYDEDELGLEDEGDEDGPGLEDLEF